MIYTKINNLKHKYLPMLISRQTKRNANNKTSLWFSFVNKTVQFAFKDANTLIATKWWLHKFQTGSELIRKDKKYALDIIKIIMPWLWNLLHFIMNKSTKVKAYYHLDYEDDKQFKTNMSTLWEKIVLKVANNINQIWKFWENIFCCSNGQTDDCKSVWITTKYCFNKLTFFLRYGKQKKFCQI